MDALPGLRADLHIHSVLSPCAERDMTPGNIVGMAKLLGLDVIAITDHQACGNCAAAMAIAAAMDGPLVIPGMEVESAEEIHLLCLFPDLEAARACEAKIRASMPDRPNRVDIFGEQWLMDASDEISGKEPRMLMAPSRLDSGAIAGLVLDLGGTCVPAHLDREANSMLVSLGDIPPEFPTDVIELSCNADPCAFYLGHPSLAGYRCLLNSDAHSLQTFAEQGTKTVERLSKDRPAGWIRPSAKQVVEALRPRRS